MAKYPCCEHCPAQESNEESWAAAWHAENGRDNHLTRCLSGCRTEAQGRATPRQRKPRRQVPAVTPEVMHDGQAG